MRLLVLGGTAFLGRALACAALGSGHHVTCAARGVTGRPPEGVHLVRIDRSAPDAYAAVGGDFDAVVDVSSRPSHVRTALSALADRVEHWIYVSSISVYSDNATPGQRASTAPTVPAAPPDVDDPEADGYAQYRPCKMACEEAVRETVGETRAFICRPGMIGGAEDATGRFTYWVARLSMGGEALVPGGPDDAVQWIDVRDLAEWLVRVAARRTSGVYDGIGLPMPRAEFLAGVAEGVGVRPDYTYVSHDFLTGRGVNLWGGPRSLPFWFPLPEYAGILSRDTKDALAAGLTLRPLADTARFTHDWWRSQPPADRRLGAGLTAQEEAEILEAWRVARH
jgi:nucleoside-diphosphate-sugar epimerase